MSREVRMVPPDWEHPRNESGDYIPLVEGSFAKESADWDEGCAKWAEGFRRVHSMREEAPRWVEREENCSYQEWAGERPKPDQYMPEFEPGTATYLMMYESTSEGTPISPAFATPEELARWLADSNASAFGGMTATYEQWLSTCRSGWAPSMIVAGGRLMSGVEA